MSSFFSYTDPQSIMYTYKNILYSFSSPRGKSLVELGQENVSGHSIEPFCRSNDLGTFCRVTLSLQVKSGKRLHPVESTYDVV